LVPGFREKPLSFCTQGLQLAKTAALRRIVEPLRDGVDIE
jgi:hypothetical protein